MEIMPGFTLTDIETTVRASACDTAAADHPCCCSTATRSPTLPGTRSLPVSRNASTSSRPT